MRPALPTDVDALMALYQRAARRADEDPLFLDRRRMVEAVSSSGHAWLVRTDSAGPMMLISFLVDREQCFAKIQRMYVDPRVAQRDSLLREGLEQALEHLTSTGVAEIVYTTTRSLTLQEQAFTLELGFKALGIFPSALGVDRSRLNGLTAYYSRGILELRDALRFPLHPGIAPLYEITRRECGLGTLPAAGPVGLPESGTPPPGPLELVQAPRFVEHRYRRLQERRSLSVTFYPFQQPNVLVTDASQQVEVFCRLSPAIRFASIIGEHLETSVDPVALYRELSKLLYSEGASYVEVIIDAADSAGIECLLGAGYLPCAYFPCFRRRRDDRRDYVIFSRSFEALTFEDFEVEPVYLDYLREYLRCLRRAQTPARWHM